LRNDNLSRVPYICQLKESNVRKGFVKDAEYEALARETAAGGLWLRAMFEVSYTYGRRKMELLTRRVRHADLLERTLRLDAGETKNGEARTVEMTGKVFELLKRCSLGKGEDDFLFTRERDRRGRKVRTGGRIVDFREDWEAATQAAGVPELLFHDLRRSAVGNMVRDGVSEKQAMTISGHRTRSDLRSLSHR
jgi:integrase